MTYMINVYGFKVFANSVSELQAKYDVIKPSVPAGEKVDVYKSHNGFSYDLVRSSKTA